MKTKDGEHKWSKQNLVTRNDGTDLWKCTYCNKKEKTYLGRPDGGSCKNAPKVQIDINGGWVEKRIINTIWCQYCHTKVVITPKKGHQNSKYWRLRRNKKEVLYNCPNGCLEDGTIVKNKKKKKKKPLMMIVDGNLFAFRAYMTRELKTSMGVPTSVISGLMQMIRNLYDTYGHENILICWDSKGGSELRREIFKGYKGTRGEKPDDLKMQLKMAYRFFKSLNVRQARVKGIEGDDLMGMFAHYFSENGYRVLIASDDKDLWQLVKKRVAIWRPINKELITVKVLKEKFDGLGAKGFLRMKALQGDKGDNIPGIPGIGPKTAQKIIKKFGTIQKIFRSKEKDKHVLLIQKNKKIVRTAFDLSRIRTEPEELEISYKKFLKMVDSINKRRKVSEEKMHKQIRKLEMKHRNFEALANAFALKLV